MAWSKGREGFGIRLYKEYFNFAAAHFLIFADGRREELHGHNYRATLTLEGALGAAGLVADFLVVKPLFRAECDLLDHRVLLPRHNPWLSVEEHEREVHAALNGARFVLPRADVRLLEIENTSSELLARLLADGFLARLEAELPALVLRRVEVSVQESPGQCAVFERCF